MRFDSNIKVRQLRKQFDLPKLKEIGAEMLAGQQFGLTVEKEKLGVNSLSFLEGFKHLQVLTIYNISKDIAAVAQLKDLRQLALCGLKLSNADFLKSLPKLEYLWIQGSRFDFDVLRELTQVKALQLFNLRNMDNVDFLKDMVSLQYIEADRCSNLTEFPDLSKLTDLRRVRIDTAKRLKDISQIAKAPNLEDLIVVNAKELPVDCFDDFIEHKTLKKILIGVDMMNSKKYKEIEKRVPKHLQMDGFYGTKNQFFELK